MTEHDGARQLLKRAAAASRANPDLRSFHMPNGPEQLEVRWAWPGRLLVLDPMGWDSHIVVACSLPGRPAELDVQLFAGSSHERLAFVAALDLRCLTVCPSENSAAWRQPLAR